MGRGPVVRFRKDESEQAKEEGEIWKGVEQDHDFFLCPNSTPVKVREAMRIRLTYFLVKVMNVR